MNKSSIIIYKLRATSWIKEKSMNSAFDKISSLKDEYKYVFNLIQKGGPLTKQDLISLSKIKLTTLNRILDQLKEKGLVLESGIAESSGGRRPVLYDVISDTIYLVGVDISRTNTMVVITNLKMETVFKDMFIMDKSSNPVRTAELIFEIINTAIRKLRISLDQLVGVGIGAVGPLNRKEGILLNPINYPSEGWHNVEITKLLSQRFKLPAFLDNGANTAVLAESLYGCGKGYENIAYLNIGVGIRMGAVASGNLVRTLNDSEDAFAHMIVDVDGIACICGNYGCIECYATIQAVTKEFISAFKKGKKSIIEKPIEEITYLDICTAADNGDELSRQILHDTTLIVGTGISNYIKLLNPNMMVISGPIAVNCDYFYENCVEAAMGKLNGSDREKITFSKGGHFGDSAIAVGAAVVVLEKALERRTAR